jgi:hypothetical protein
MCDSQIPHEAIRAMMADGAAICAKLDVEKCPWKVSFEDRERESFIDNLLVRIHLIIEMNI